MSRVCESQAPDLFDAETVVSTMPDGVPIEICISFERLALQVVARGFTRYSARAIAHRMRWEEHIERGNREFKINNNWTADLARWFIARHPEHTTFFELRESAED